MNRRGGSRGQSRRGGSVASSSNAPRQQMLCPMRGIVLEERGPIQDMPEDDEDCCTVGWLRGQPCFVQMSLRGVGGIGAWLN